MNSLELYKPNNSALNRFSKLFSKIQKKQKNGINSINVNLRRNSMTKKYNAWLDDEKNEDKFIKAYNLYIEALNDYMMNKIYKKVKMECANDYEKKILSEYYYVLKLKEELYDEYKLRKEKYLMNLDYENILSDEKKSKDAQSLYKCNINYIYRNLLHLYDDKSENEKYEYYIKIIQEYNDDKLVKFILNEKNIEPYECENEENDETYNMAKSNIKRYTILLNISEAIFKEIAKDDFINYVNKLIKKEEEKLKNINKRKIKLCENEKKSKRYIKVMGSIKNEK